MTKIFKKISRFIASVVVALFSLNTLYTPVSFGQVAFLPAAGTMVPMTGKYNPVVIKGVQLHPDNPFKFDFIVDTGDTKLSQEDLKIEGQKLIGYFLASLTTPEKEMWVNLSPYEKDRIIPKTFGETEMGRDLLSQDYLLKQIMATALYPERQLGQEFWQKVYSEAQAKFGTTNVPVSTFNKVWILPDKAVVYENSRTNSVFVVESSLKVMLEQDYLAMKAPQGNHGNASPNINALGSQIIREIVIPALTKEVNEGKNFAPLRQVYQSLILAAWYKKNLKDNVIAQAYVDRNKTKGVDVADKTITQKIYKQYLQAYRKGVYNFIKEVRDPITQAEFPRKYFSGGLVMGTINQAMVTIKDNKLKSVRLNLVNNSGSFSMIETELNIANANQPATGRSDQEWVRENLSRLLLEMNSLQGEIKTLQTQVGKLKRVPENLHYLMRSLERKNKLLLDPKIRNIERILGFFSGNKQLTKDALLAMKFDSIRRDIQRITASMRRDIVYINTYLTGVKEDASKATKEAEEAAAKLNYQYSIKDVRGRVVKFIATIVGLGTAAFIVWSVTQGGDINHLTYSKKNPESVASINDSTQERIITRSNLLKYVGTGTILDPDNHKIWEEVSSTEMRYKPSGYLKEDDVRKIARGDFERIQTILQQARVLKIQDRFPGMSSKETEIAPARSWPSGLNTNIVQPPVELLNPKNLEIYPNKSNKAMLSRVQLFALSVLMAMAGASTAPGQSKFQDRLIPNVAPGETVPLPQPRPEFPALPTPAQVPDVLNPIKGINPPVLPPNISPLEFTPGKVIAIDQMSDDPISTALMRMAKVRGWGVNPDFDQMIQDGDIRNAALQSYSDIKEAREELSGGQYIFMYDKQNKMPNLETKSRPNQLEKVPLPRPNPLRNNDHAMNGGIDLGSVDVNAKGSGVRTAFSDPEQLKMLLKADGLVAVIYRIQPLSAHMINLLLGL